MTNHTTTLDLDGIEAVIRNAALIDADIAPATAAALLDEVRRLRARVTELEAYAHGCDAEGCVLPHSSWCERAKKTAAENDGCTCGQPWTGHPQPHAMHCWTVNPPRAEVEEMRREIAELRRVAAEPQAAADLADRLEAALTERFTALGNPFSEMRRHEQGPDGWPASHPVGPNKVAEVLRELMADETPAERPAVAEQPDTQTREADRG